ncbi:hypothetical protein LCGC14_1906550 [marine sediment metagenome]|uniref:Uncharacterized protein n=1 Tax=marine sediment metagenome TaxID=412755 RepID=A0A0F9GIC7_9ZZZZ
MSQPLLSASRILEAEDLAEHIEEVPEWPNEDGSPGHLRLVQMTAAENIELTNLVGESKETIIDGMFLILVYCAKDEEGKRLFTKEDVVKLREKNFHVINRLQQLCLKLNNTGAKEEADTKNA